MALWFLTNRLTSSIDCQLIFKPSLSLKFFLWEIYSQEAILCFDNFLKAPWSPHCFGLQDYFSGQRQGRTRCFWCLWQTFQDFQHLEESDIWLSLKKRNIIVWCGVCRLLCGILSEGVSVIVQTSTELNLASPTTNTIIQTHCHQTSTKTNSLLRLVLCTS